ncbi:MAG: ABC transporter permease subunit [Bacillota bacterium]|nr:ABC transporter permease subunit [Bacillota bacterium]
MKNVVKHKAHLLMLMPGLVFLIIFHYIPMGGIILAFKDHMLMKGVLRSPWVGLKHFEYLFSSPEFFRVLRNTLVISMLKLLCGFPIPIIFALLLNEVRHIKYRKLVQTISYMPHFISWVILAGVFIDLLSLDGPVNGFLRLLGNKPVIFLSRPNYFWFIMVVTHIWKTFGWSSIIYFAALSNVDPNLLEAATVDGAGRFRKAVSISLPCIMPTVLVILILNTGGILSAGFDQIFNMYNPAVMDVADILDTYVYRRGLIKIEYSYSTAVGLFKSVVALIMIVTTNRIARVINEGEGLW